MSSSLGELADHQNSKTSSSSSSSTSTTSSISYSTPPALIAFTLTVVVVCFICFSAVYFCRCYLVSVIQTWALHHPASATLMRLSPAPNTNSRSPFTGLHPSLLHSFPTFPFSSLPKDDTIREMKYKLECAICLVEFEEDSTLRQLPVCWHMFHQDCVDLWLRSNKTCPVCRTDLETRKCLDDEHTVEEQGGGSSDEVRIDVNEEEEEGGEAGEQRFSRSHSTGHSIVMVRGGGDRLGRNDDEGYRLRLQKHASLGSVGRGKHSCSRSCATYREMMMMVVVARPSTTDYLQIMPASSSPIALQNV